jgi:hypothetical protein
LFASLTFGLGEEFESGFAAPSISFSRILGRLLKDAIVAWHRLRPEQAQRASIRIIGGQLYAVAEIPKLLNGSRSKGA